MFSLIEGEELVKFIKSQRLGLFGRKDLDVSIKEIIDWKPAKGRHRRRANVRWQGVGNYTEDGNHNKLESKSRKLVTLEQDIRSSNFTQQRI